MRALALAAGLAINGAPVAACDGQGAPCETASGTYHVAVPEEGTGHPLMIFLHGFGGKATGYFRDGGMAERAAARGWAFAAPQGLTRPGGTRSSWGFHPDWEAQRDEPAFFAELIADAATRFDVDPARVVLAGFSIGGSMSTYTACSAPEGVLAFAPVGGSIWRPHPEGCEAPVDLYHSHGWNDGTVPLEGRFLGLRDGEAFHQGDTFFALQLLREANGCQQTRPDVMSVEDGLWTRSWTSCDSGKSLTLELFDGGHQVPRGWLGRVLDWAEGL
ncbi:alpha/beta hydrolase family esterase [Pseudaestuariivita sp.]|uniref:alpha/beta hydrolase family esterase n=1 Tax=Pseudaestuariivita sp. TaxID=2211669 RepID=UPI004059A3F2